jgi:hypothetical protein
MDLLGLERVFIGSLILYFLVASVFIFIITYLVRRLEIGENPARREIKIAIIGLMIILPLIFIFTFAIYKSPHIDTILSIFAALVLVIVIGHPLFWRFKTRKARNSELFQIPVKQSLLFLLIAIIFPLAGGFRLFLSDLNPADLLVSLGQILVGLWIGIAWLRPTWHVTKEGIFWYWAFIKWEQVIDHEWQPLNKQEVLFRLRIKYWFIRGRHFNQPIPVAFERPLKAIMQKYTEPEALDPSLSEGNLIV